MAAEEDADLMVVSSTEATRKAAVSEKIATKKTHSPTKSSSTPISKSADDIMTFRKELDALALKHLGPVPAPCTFQYNSVNTGSDIFSTGFEEVNSGNIEANSPSADHDEEVFSDSDDDKMPEIRIYDKLNEGIFEKASYDDDGIITDFNNLPDEEDTVAEQEGGERSRNCQKQSQGLVAQVHRHEEGIDYDVGLLLGFMSHNLPGFVDTDHPTKVYKVVIALYGLHQALELLRIIKKFEVFGMSMLHHSHGMVNWEEGVFENGGMNGGCGVGIGSYSGVVSGKQEMRRYALTANPTIYDSLVKQFWQSAIASTKEDGSLEISATIDTIRYTISEASIRDSLQLDDATGITMLPNDDLFAGMGQIGYPTDGTFTFWKSFFTPQWRYLVHHILHCISSKSGGWDQFGSNIATALICLSTGRVYNFSKLIFDEKTITLNLRVSLTKKIFWEFEKGLQSQPSPTPPPIPPSTSLPPPIPSPTPPPIPTPPLPPSPSPKSPPPPPEPEPITDEPSNHGGMHSELVEGEEIGRVYLRGGIYFLTDSEDEEPEAQGRKGQADPQDSSIQGLVTPPTTKAHASGEEQEEDISPNTLEAAKTLSKVASLKVKGSIDNGRRSNTGAENINAASIKVNTVSKVNTGSIELNTVIEQDVCWVKIKDKEKESSYAHNKIGFLIKKRGGWSNIHLDALLAQRIAEEEELTEQQKKRKAQVQFEAQHYTNEDWDLIRAKLEANAELSKSMLGSELQGEDFAKKMVDLVNQRKKFFAEERAKAKRNKSMTQSQL
ncbi:hypothetical protein Tco_0824624 [Tanacetum coccineum]|uniref:Uncharacterized protein n=1 Tax=Tanacetum coccineum TaxID=301880 RepID=A0ABQ5AL97_9ASTR